MTRRQIAWILILIVDVGYIAWGTGVAIAPDRLLGPGGKAPLIAGYMKVLYRMYGVYNILFGLLCSAITVTAFRRGSRWAWWTLLVGNTVALVSAMTYDKIVNAIGPFEMTEYLGLALVWGALAITAQFRAEGRPVMAAS